MAPSDEDDEHEEFVRARFAPPDRRETLLLIALSPFFWLARLLKRAIRGVGLVLAAPVLLLRWRDTERQPPDSTVDGLRRELARLPAPMREDVRFLLAGIVDDLHERWQVGARIRPRAYVLTDRDGARSVRPLRLRWTGRPGTSVEWLPLDTVSGPGRIATAVVRPVAELPPRSRGRDYLLTVLLRHVTNPPGTEVALVGSTRGFVVRRIRLAEEYGSVPFGVT